MSQNYRTRTNEKLNFAKVHIELLNEAKTSSAPVFRRALVESAVFHLYGALFSYVRETANASSIPDQEISLATTPEQLVIARDYLGPEMLAIAQGMQDSHHWLGQLVDAFEQLGRGQISAGREEQVSEITLVSLDENPLADAQALETVTMWLSNLRSMVESGRHQMQEC